MGAAGDALRNVKVKMAGGNVPLGSITSRCSGNESALLLFSSRGGTKTALERAAEIEPNVPSPLSAPLNLVPRQH